jgi:proteasome lid subunit RPN8/RPN11
MSEFRLSPDLIGKIAAHARAEYPKESCGLIVAGAYQPCANVADDPENDFAISAKVIQKAMLSGKLEAVVHSHPNGPHFPTERDMLSQVATNVPWVITPLDEDRDYPPVIWGANTPIAPIIGREFVHGVTDCYSLIRDAFRLGRDELAKQDVEWPFEPQDVPDFARNDAWWSSAEGQEPQDLYADNFAKAGFYEIPRESARAGDVFLCKIRSDKLNHGGVIVGGGMIMHHLPSRLSRREPAGLWQRAADLWLRYKATETDDAA